MDLEEALDGDELPGEFHLGRPGRSSVYHTEVCEKVKSSLKRKSMARRGITGNYIRITTERIKSFHDLTLCGHCAGEGDKSNPGDKEPQNK